MPARILVDTTGTMFTIAIEQEFPDLAKLAADRQREQALYGTDLFRQWFESWCGAVESGERQVFTVVD